MCTMMSPARAHASTAAGQSACGRKMAAISGFSFSSIASSLRCGAFDQLQMDLTAKTYRYLDDEEVAQAEADRRKSEQAAKRPAG